ncbi:MAG TPA: hypothetical protein VNJ02_18535 [Vicinamibacterales bacterium]|nr:hypothetical protein [Vicinamibacterales bacterium]
MIMLPVPVEHYPAVIVFLGQLMSGGAPPPVTPTEHPGTGSEDAFPREVIQRMKVEPQFPVVQAMLDLVAERPGRPVTLPEVMSRAGGVEPRDARGQLAGFTKMLRRWGVAGGRWPVRAERDANGRVFYLGTKEFANEWLKKP